MPLPSEATTPSTTSLKLFMASLAISPSKGAETWSSKTLPTSASPCTECCMYGLPVALFFSRPYHGGWPSRRLRQGHLYHYGSQIWFLSHQQIPKGPRISVKAQSCFAYTQLTLQPLQHSSEMTPPSGTNVSDT